MTTKKYKMKNNLKIHFIILGFIMFATAFLSIGYATISPVDLNVEGDVVASTQSGIFITDAVYVSDVNADTINSKVNNFYAAMLNTSAVLSPTDPNSSVTYEVTIYNSTDIDYVFKKVEYGEEWYSNNDIEFQLNDLQELVTPLYAGDFITFTITFKYANNTIALSNVLNSILDFKFTILANVATGTDKLKSYHIGYENQFTVDIINKGNTPVTANLSIDGLVVSQTIDVAGKETKTVNITVSDNFLKKALLGKEYPVTVNLIGLGENYTGILNTYTTFEEVPTITNFYLRDTYGADSTKLGTAENPYIVYKAEDLIRLASIVNGYIDSNNTTTRYSFTNEIIKMIKDINFANQNDYYDPDSTNLGDVNNTGNIEGIFTQMSMEEGTGFRSIGRSSIDGNDAAGTERYYFKGIFEGNNHTISNLYINPTIIIRRVGLFGYIEDATIQNLTVSGNFKCKGDAGGLVGYAAGTCHIINCNNYIDIENRVRTNDNGYFSVGGILGMIQANANIEIKNCNNYGNIINNASTAGFVGLVMTNANLLIENCCNDGDIESLVTDIAITNENWNFSTAGLVVKDASSGANITIKNSCNRGNVTGRYRVAGLVSIEYGGTLNVIDSYNTGTITGRKWIAGILSVQRGGVATLTRVYNTGTISGLSPAKNNVGNSSNNFCGQIVGEYRAGEQTITLGSSPVGVTINDEESSFDEPSTLSLDLNTEQLDSTFLMNYELMKTNEFIEFMGPAFKADTTGKNKGYPILTWE